MEFLSHANNVFNPIPDAIGHKIGVAGADKSAAKIVLAGRGRISLRLIADHDVAVPGVSRVWRIVNLLVRIKPGFKTGEGNHDFKNRAGLIIFLSSAIDLRAEKYICQLEVLFRSKVRDIN